MKIFHTADHHLSIKKGKETIPYSFENNIIEFNKFSDNLFKKFENLVEKAIKENIDIFISAGDIFHTINVQKYELDRFYKSIKKLEENNILFVECPGNHTSPVSPNGIHSLFSIKYFSNVIMSDDYGKYIEIKKDISVKNEKLNIVICPYLKNPPRFFYNLSEREQEDYLLGRYNKVEDKEIENNSNISPSEENKYFSRAIERVFLKINRELKNEINKNIFVGHFNVDGAKLSGERDFNIGNGWGVSKNIFDKMDSFSYIALGHIHINQCLSSISNAWFSGSISELNFGEIEDKFYNEVIIENNKVEVKNNIIPKDISFEKITLGDLTIYSGNLTDYIFKKIEGKDLYSKIVEIKGTILYSQEKTIDKQKIINFLEKKVYSFEGFDFEKKSDFEQNKKGGKEESINLLTGNEEFDVLNLTKRYVSEKNKEEIINRTKEYIKKTKE